MAEPAGTPDGPAAAAAAAAAAQLQQRLHFAYPVVLLVFFLVSFMTHSILATAPEKHSTEAPVSGPGGKPLPRNKRRYSQAPRPQLPDFGPGAKAFFKWTTVAVSLTFLVQAALIILHVLVARSEGWWCGQHAAVSLFPPNPTLPPTLFSPARREPGLSPPHPSLAHAPGYLPQPIFGPLADRICDPPPRRST